MKILYLGYAENVVHSFLQTKGEVYHTEEKLTLDFAVEDFDWVISYGYSHIIKEHHILKTKNPIINLHISYLPYNRGADPNFWSWFENTPKGITIHQIDRGIDTGDILIQKQISFEGDQTLASSYAILREEIEKLFLISFDDIIKGRIVPKKQEGVGSFHLTKDLVQHKHLLNQGWNTPTNQIK